MSVLEACKQQVALLHLHIRETSSLWHHIILNAHAEEAPKLRIQAHSLAYEPANKLRRLSVPVRRTARRNQCGALFRAILAHVEVDDLRCRLSEVHGRANGESDDACDELVHRPSRGGKACKEWRALFLGSP